MAKIVIAELDIDVQAMIQSTSQVKKSIDDLKKLQKELTDSGDTNSKSFVENASNLKALNQEYTAGVKAIVDNTKATAEQANRTELLKVALQGEVSSIAEARAQNSLLNKLRNETNVTTDEGKKQLTDLNKKLDQNNEFIKENADAYLKQKINIGNYSDSVKDALQNINPFNGGVSGFTQRAQEAGGAGNLMKTSIQGVTSGIFGMIKASLAFIATPIGAVIAVIAGAAIILYNVFKSFQPVVDKVEQGFASLSAVFNVVKNTVLALVTGAKSLKEAFSGLGTSMSKAADEAAKLTKAQQDLDDIMAHQEVTTARNRAEINKLNVQLKDRTKTEEERLKISDKIVEKEQEDFKQRKAIADEEIRIARGNIALKAQFTDAEKKLLKEQGDLTKELAESRGGNYDKEYEALNKARIKAIDLENEVSVNIEKQYVKRNKIEDEANDKKQKAESDAQAIREKAKEQRQKEIDDIIEKSNIQIEIFKATEGEKEKTALQTASFNKQLFEKESADLKLQFDKGKISKEQYELEKLQISQNYAKQQVESIAQFANAELNLFLENNKSKLVGAQILTDELVAEEQRRLLLIQEKRVANLASEKEIDVAKLEQKKLNNEALTITELEFETERIRISSETDNTIQTNKKTLEDQIKQQKAEQLAIDKELAIADAQTKAEEDSIKAQQDYDAEIARFTALLEAKKITQGQYDTFKKSSDDKKAALDRQRELQQVQGVLGGLNTLSSAVGEMFGQSKELALVQAGINGAMAVTSILAQYPKFDGGFAMTAAIVGAGVSTIAQIAKIAKAKPPTTPKFEKGGIQEIGGKRHSAGGTRFWGEDGTTFEAEQGEGIGVLNRGAFASFMNFNNTNGSGISSPTFMAGGGIITQGVQSSNGGINAEEIMSIIQNIPAPIVAVTDIHEVSERYTQVVNGADL